MHLDALQILLYYMYKCASTYMHKYMYIHESFYNTKELVHVSFVNKIQTRDNQEEGNSVEGLLPSDWPMEIFLTAN